MTSIYDRIGGAPAVEAAVDIFYNKVIADERINYWFSHMDMNAQRQKQSTFLTMAFGGPSAYSGRDMSAAHAKLVSKGLNDAHFDAVAEDLVCTLQELQVPEALIQEIGALLESQRDAVLCRGTFQSAAIQAPGSAWRNYRLTSRVELTPNTGESYNVQLTLAAEDGQPLALAPGQHIKIGATVNEQWLQNSYTPLPSSNAGEITLMLKVYNNGKLSRFLGASLDIGGSVSVGGPFGHYLYEHDKTPQPRCINMIACGSGITPMYQVMRWIAQHDDASSVRLLYGNRYENDIALKDDLEALAGSSSGKTQVFHTLSKPPAENWTGLCGRIGQQTMQETLFPSSANTLNLVCGTEDFGVAVKAALEALGHAQSSIVIF